MFSAFVNRKCKDTNAIPESETSMSEFSEESKETLSWSSAQSLNVGVPIALSSRSADDVISDFENLLSGVLAIRADKANVSESEWRNHVLKINSWLRNTDFYTAPASTRYHESFKHGLLYHTISVYNNMLDLIQLPKFRSVELDSAALCCICHDWCKIGFYETYMRNVKNEDTGQWERVEAYRTKDAAHPFGHGVASMYIASKFFKLTEGEALAIRWHMSMFNVAPNEINEYQVACEMNPIVHLIQFADQLSITNY